MWERSSSIFLKVDAGPAGSCSKTSWTRESRVGPCCQCGALKERVSEAQHAPQPNGSGEQCPAKQQGPGSSPTMVPRPPPHTQPPQKLLFCKGTPQGRLLLVWPAPRARSGEASPHLHQSCSHPSLQALGMDGDTRDWLHGSHQQAWEEEPALQQERTTPAKTCCSL